MSQENQNDSFNNTIRVLENIHLLICRNQVKNSEEAKVVAESLAFVESILKQTIQTKKEAEKEPSTEEKAE